MQAPPTTSPSLRPDARAVGEAMADVIARRASVEGARGDIVDKRVSAMMDLWRGDRSQLVGHLIQFYAELYGAFCEDLAHGFAEWAADVDESHLTCPSCDAAMIQAGRRHVCPECQWSEER